ncbi:hypothetical protein SGRA_0740 [Saprospira grandis str. Lewin]|uniref:Uncharacterized protein n=1 Tax=Saprospira grandis (strain Lewin) TaxID=984262 RepID=H6L1D8_SAPGL|nr:hypothetical protein SGRA_0740 [Saprospira grandis str. Lewin]
MIVPKAKFFCLGHKKATLLFEESGYIFSAHFGVLQARRAAGLAMCKGGRRPDRSALALKGRANSEPWNVAPAEGRRPQNKNYFIGE